MNAPADPEGGLGDRSPGGHRRPRRIGVAVGLAVAFAAVVVRDSIAVSPGEPGWLRWLRVLADHPIRAGLAASLLVLALSPAKASVDDPNRPPSS